MAKLTALISCISEVTGVPRPTVQEVARRLREGGLIQTGGRGRDGGADMTPEDAASLLTAILIVRASSVSFSKIVRLTRSHLRDLRSYKVNVRGKSSDRGNLTLDIWDKTLALPQLCRLRRGHTFGDALTALIGSISNGDLKKAVADWASNRPHGIAPFFTFEVRILGPRPDLEGQIEFNTAAFDWLGLRYLRPQDAKTSVVPDAPRRLRDLEQPEYPGFDLVATAVVTQETLTAIGNLLSEGT